MKRLAGTFAKKEPISSNVCRTFSTGLIITALFDTHDFVISLRGSQTPRLLGFSFSAGGSPALPSVQSDVVSPPRSALLAAKSLGVRPAKTTSVAGEQRSDDGGLYPRACGTTLSPLRRLRKKTVRFCDHCRAADRLPDELLAQYQMTPFCSECNNAHGCCHFCRGALWAVPAPTDPGAPPGR